MRSSLRLAVALLAAAGSSLVLAQSPQAPANPTPTFRTQVEYVEVDALVTDKEGQFVRGLTKDDFQVFEDGKRQQISSFTLVDIPVDRADRPLFSSTVIEPDTESNERPFDGRVYVLVLDDLHVAPFRTQRVRSAARQFIQRNMGANDRMAIIFTAGRAQDSQDFTSNKRLLLNAVDRFTGQKLDSITMSRNREYYNQRDLGVTGSSIMDPDEQQRAYYTRSTLTTLRQVAEWFGGVRGRRKSMLFISEGIDYDITDLIRASDAPSSQASGIIDDIREAIAATARSNVSIYSIDPRGLATGADDTIEVGQFADSDDPRAGIGAGSLANELRLSQDNLRQLSDETGGVALINRNDYTNGFDRIVRDNSSYYVLAYYPPSEKRDGKFHKIEVKTARPGLTVRARRGYSSPRGKPPAPPKTGNMAIELFNTINSPLPVSGGLRMRVFAAPFKGSSPNASVVIGVELLGRDLTLENGKVEVSYMAIDARAKIFGAKNEVLTLNLRPETRDRVNESGLRVLNRMEIPAGRYQLRIAARDPAKGSTGSVIHDLEVPDFYKLPFGISGLAMTSLGGGSLPTAKLDEQLSGVLPAPVTAQRTFPQNDELAIFAEVYDNAGGPAHKVDIVTSVLTDEGRVLFKNEESRDSSELQGAKGAYGYTTRVPLSEIAPGRYVLNVEARSRLGRDVVATRQVQFEVVAPAR